MSPFPRRRLPQTSVATPWVPKLLQTAPRAACRRNSLVRRAKPAGQASRNNPTYHTPSVKGTNKTDQSTNDAPPILSGRLFEKKKNERFFREFVAPNDCNPASRPRLLPVNKKKKILDGGSLSSSEREPRLKRLPAHSAGSYFGQAVRVPSGPPKNGLCERENAEFFAPLGMSRDKKATNKKTGAVPP